MYNNVKDAFECQYFKPKKKKKKKREREKKGREDCD